ncbi:MAG: hypothetical protein GY845_30495 [Planctomycetes bacterium]|nr:hypothetical protein [Planctomycetota bacterium]
MSNFFICEVCGVEGEAPIPAPTCIRCMPRPAPAANEITTFSMGLYTMKVCRGCRQRLGDDGLRNRIREKVSRSKPVSG